ncbi:MAG: DegT/DnrJ/EryC1/StrS family aminotransferase, partial [Lysobacteraceae bacterium]
MRNFGFETYDKAVHVGTNGKMPEICAAMGLTNLESLDAVVEANRANHRLYSEAFAGIDGIHLLDYDPTESSNWQYVVIEVDRTFRASRDEIVAALHAEGILARKYFWPGCHNMQPFRELYPHAGLLLPNTMAVADRVIVLPTGTTLPSETVGVIADVLRVLSGA